MEPKKLPVIVTGGDPKKPEIIKCSGAVPQELKKRLSELNSNAPYLIHAQVGAGKTYAVLHTLLPYALEQGKRILYVSSRVALNAQTKKDIISVTGEQYLLRQHTSEGMLAQEDFAGITVITYHRLYSLMMHDPNRLKTFDILVFDEIHALLEDASFVPYTGYALSHIKDFFGAKPRIYLSATPEEILPELISAESPYRLTVLRFPRNFSYVRPVFFHSEEEIVRRINADNSNRKWLIYTSTVKHGEALRDQLSCSVRMLNSTTREEDTEAWDRLLQNQRFDEKVAISTAVIDAGVNLVDNCLTNIVVFPTSVTTLVQVLGRKRRKGNEPVNLFVCCPSTQDVLLRLKEVNALLDALALCHDNYALFEERHILRPENYADMRNFVCVGWNSKLYVNPLARTRPCLKNTTGLCYFNNIAIAAM